MDKLNSFQFLKAIFLLILAVSGNFVAETLGCGTQKLLTENMFAKHFVIFMMIYFTLGFVGDNDVHPRTNFIFSGVLYVGFILFTKMNLYFTLLALVILFAIYVIHDYVDYYEKKKINEARTKTLKTLGHTLSFVLIILIIVGFILYTIRQRGDHGADWKTHKFLFGVNECDFTKGSSGPAPVSA